MNVKKIYKQGFVDGMRNCGFLMYDIKDANLQLTDEWIKTIDEEFAKRGFSESGEWAEFHKEYKDTILQLEALKTAYSTLHEAYFNLHALPRHAHLKE